jgi:hypothetical protein
VICCARWSADAIEHICAVMRTRPVKAGLAPVQRTVFVLVLARIIHDGNEQAAWR